jgi:hypothetical protein
VHHLVQPGPQLLRQALAGVVANAALGAEGAAPVRRLLDALHHLGHRDLVGPARRLVAALAPAGETHQLVAPQLREQQLQAIRRHALALADALQRHRPALRQQRQVHHDRDRHAVLGEASLGGGFHTSAPQLTRFLRCGLAGSAPARATRRRHLLPP